MIATNPRQLTPSQLAKYHRQRKINLLDRATKSLFRLFRREVSQEEIAKRFEELMTSLNELQSVALYDNYHRAVIAYLDSLGKKIESWQTIVSSQEMTELNRLQKLKNEWQYKKPKYKKRYDR